MLKKIALFLFAPILFACSSDDSTTNPETYESVLISKITETVYYSNTESTSVTNFNYASEKLASITSGDLNNKIEFIYEGDKIVKANQINNNTIVGFNTLTYEGNNLKSIIQSNNSNKTEYTYSNNTLNTEVYSSLYDGAWTQMDKKTYTFVNGNTTQIINHMTNTGINLVSKSTYTFDSKNNPMRDMNPVIRLLLSFEGFSPLNLNNEISQKSFNSLEATTPSEEYSYDIIYNSSDFPTQIIRKATGSTDPISKTVIEYQ